MEFDNYLIEGVHTDIEQVNLEGENVIRVVKKDKLMEFDENTYAKLVNTSFHNGVIELKMLSRLLPDAPDFARGFIGVAFRINDSDTQFESFYVRPTNGRSNDPIRKMRGLQYFSYPTYTFEYFRNKNITDYEGPADIGINEWISVKIVVQDGKGTLYLNDSTHPSLIVDKMKMGSKASGNVGLFVDIGTEAFFKEIVITSDH